MDHSRTRPRMTNQTRLLHAIRMADLPSGVKHYLYGLSPYIGNGRWTAWPTVETVARELGVSIRSAKYWRQQASGMGLIRSVRRRNSSAITEVQIDQIEARIPEQEEVQPLHFQPDQEVQPLHFQESGSAKNDNQEVQLLHSGSATIALRKDQGKEQGKEQNPPESAASSRSRASGCCGSGFDPTRTDPPEHRNGYHPAEAAGSPRIDADDPGGVWVPPDDPLRAHVGSELARVCGCSTSQITPMRVGEIVRALNGHASRKCDPTEWGGDSPYDPIRMATAALEVAAGATLNGRRGARAVAGVVGYAVAVIAENRGFGEYPEPITRTAPMSPGERKRAEFAEKLKAAQALREKRQ